MKCKEARALIKRLLEICIRKMPREVRLASGELSRDLMKYAAAFHHLRECKEKKCSLVLNDLEAALRNCQDHDFERGLGSPP